MRCVKCGNEFERRGVRGQPRKHCYSCQPDRTGKYVTANHTRAHVFFPFEGDSVCANCGALKSDAPKYCKGRIKVKNRATRRALDNFYARYLASKPNVSP